MRDGQFMTGEGQTVSGEGRREVMREAELLLKIHVQCGEAVLVEGHTKDILMIPFSGKAEGPYFTGRILGEGMDVQKAGKDGKRILSARYVLEGQDFTGQKCRIFIENQGCQGEIYRPFIVTDSQALAGWEEEELWDTVEGIPGGVCVRIFRSREILAQFAGSVYNDRSDRGAV